MKSTIVIVCLCISSWVKGQEGSFDFYSTDTALQKAFHEARAMALHYKGNPADPVGPWYEAALPSRRAFCIRDVSHQSIAAEALGMGRANKNMFSHYVSNISNRKDWCTYWEMNYLGQAAPEDYRNDTAFWYNLNANFDLIYACWRLYLWTGDKQYISGPAFENFHYRSVTDFIDRWVLQADSLLKRPPYPNAPIPFNIQDHFHRCRGLPSYSEGVADLKMGVDLVAAIYRGMNSWSAIEALKGKQQQAKHYTQLANAYQRQLDSAWWDASASLYHTHVTNQGKFGKGEGETFLLWFNALTDTARIRHTIDHLISNAWNVENLSYLPHQLYLYGYGDRAYQYLLDLANPATPRRDYPEVSFGVVEGIVQGMMGIDGDARYNRVSTVYRGRTGDSSTIRQLPIMGTRVTVSHWARGSALLNEGHQPITWRAGFNGHHTQVIVNGKPVKTKRQTGKMGNIISYVELKVSPGQKLTAVWRK